MIGNATKDAAAGGVCNTPTAAKETDGESLARLVTRVADARDRAAFARLFEHFAPRLKSFYLRQGVVDSAAEDLVQECMVQLWNRAGDYDSGRAAVSTWLFTIARNLGIDRLRRERRYDPETPPEDALLASSLAHGDGESAPEAALASRRREEAVRAALRALPEDQRRAVDLHYGEWLTTAEIALREDVPQGTVKSRLRLALKRLRSELEAL